MSKLVRSRGTIGEAKQEWGMNSNRTQTLPWTFIDVTEITLRQKLNILGYYAKDKHY